jgi:hypothetical protein
MKNINLTRAGAAGHYGSGASLDIEVGTSGVVAVEGVATLLAREDRAPASTALLVGTTTAVLMTQREQISGPRRPC